MRVNKIGWFARGPQRAVLVDDATAPRPYQVIRVDGRVEATGWSRPQPLDPDVGAGTHALELSALVGPGAYRIVVEGLGESDVFEVRERLYGDLSRDALQFFTLWRANFDSAANDCAWSPRGCRYTHGPGAPGDEVAAQHPSVGTGTRDVSGGWFDAGDFGKYTLSGAAAMSSLLAVYELFPERFADADGSHPIPESGNGRSDLLDEVIWEARWLMKMQEPDGAVHHKVHGRDWPSGPIDPATITAGRRLQGLSTEATLATAAVLARTARALAPDDPLVPELVEAARRAWSWAEAHPSQFYTRATPDDPGGGDYEMDGGVIDDDRYRAAAELLVTTGDPAFRAVVLGSPALANTAPPTWGSVGFWGTQALASHPAAAGLPPEVARRLREAVFAQADAIVAFMSDQAFSEPIPSWTWSSNSVAANRGAILAAAWRLSDDPARRDVWSAGAATIADYLLGSNALDYSWVTGYGPPTESAHNPTSHWFQAIGAALPGLLVGGPNAQHVDDPWTPRAGPSARRYIDAERAWCSNEIAINWNAALVLLTVFADEARGGRGRAE